jgi:hypothetical protein
MVSAPRASIVRTALVAIAMGAIVAAAGRTAQAQPRDPRELDAKTACLANRPDRGIELLAELYAETNNPTYIYNQGRCFQQNGRAADAVTRFREYLRKAPSIDAAEKAQVQGYIAELEEQIRRTSAPTVALPAAAAPTASSSGTGKVGAGGGAGAAALGIAGRPGAAAGDGRQMRVAGIALGSFGLATTAVGVYMGMRTRQLTQEVSSDALKGMFVQSKYDEGQRSEILQWVGYAVGGAALVSGGLLYILGARRAVGEGPSVMAMPAVGPGGVAGGTLRVVF